MIICLTDSVLPFAVCHHHAELGMRLKDKLEAAAEAGEYWICEVRRPRWE